MDYWRSAAKTSRVKRMTNIEIINQLNVKTNTTQKLDEKKG